MQVWTRPQNATRWCGPRRHPVRIRIAVWTSGNRRVALVWSQATHNARGPCCDVLAIRQVQVAIRHHQWGARLDLRAVHQLGRVDALQARALTSFHADACPAGRTLPAHGIRCRGVARNDRARVWTVALLDVPSQRPGAVDVEVRARGRLHNTHVRRSALDLARGAQPVGADAAREVVDARVVGRDHARKEFEATFGRHSHGAVVLRVPARRVRGACVVASHVASELSAGVQDVALRQTGGRRASQQRARWNTNELQREVRLCVAL
mmetsp:Transcript_51234/g.166058  ORF Transcript_51234/g.166058 Transcript_51234/m.166058 type:complete len:266 (+) Transcript_51234:4932-5729(+)